MLVYNAEEITEREAKEHADRERSQKRSRVPSSNGAVRIWEYKFADEVHGRFAEIVEAHNQ